jgi:hypothetical protein
MKNFYILLIAMIVSAGLFAQTAVTIYEIQGQAASSPFEGQEVETTGIVTGISYNGYYIQDGPGAWNGVFVFDNNNFPSIGDEVTVTGEVQEYYELTEIGYIDAFNVNSQGNTLPDAEIISAQDANLEDYEGVLIRVESLTVTGLPNQYGIWATEDSGGTELLVDDDMFSYIPYVGEQLTLVGIMHYSFSERKLNPRSMDDIIGGSSNEVTIYDIQGQTAYSPYEGQVVSTSGIVTGVAYNGYYIQDGSGAWNGIFVFDNNNVPSMGDEVKVTGEVQEYYDMTELGYISSFSVESQGNQLPDVVTITALETAMEDYESVLVKVENIEATVLPDQYGVWRGEDENGIPVIMDDDIYEYTPNLGDHLNITGCIMYGFGEFKINPRMSDDITPYSGIYEYENNVIVSMYPNPAHDILLVSADEPITTVVISNLAGMRVLEIQGNSQNNLKLDISGLNVGVYMIEVFSPEGKSQAQKQVVR